MKCRRTYGYFVAPPVIMERLLEPLRLKSLIDGGERSPLGSSVTDSRPPTPSTMVMSHGSSAWLHGPDGDRYIVLEIRVAEIWGRERVAESIPAILEMLERMPVAGGLLSVGPYYDDISVRICKWPDKRKITQEYKKGWPNGNTEPSPSQLDRFFSAILREPLRKRMAGSGIVWSPPPAIRGYVRALEAMQHEDAGMRVLHKASVEELNTVDVATGAGIAHFAASAGHMEALRLLADRGADIGMPMDSSIAAEYLSPFLLACYSASQMMRIGTSIGSSSAARRASRRGSYLRRRRWRPAGM